jgi:hypothetical protein
MTGTIRETCCCGSTFERPATHGAHEQSEWQKIHQNCSARKADLAADRERIAQAIEVELLTSDHGAARMRDIAARIARNGGAS